MARSSAWKGTIRFGLVNIPIRLHLAVQTKNVAFRLLHKTDLVPITTKRWCPPEDAEVAYADVVRGFEVGKDTFVPISDAELDMVPLTTAHIIDVVQFTKPADMPGDLYYSKSYFIEPEIVGATAYSLLRAALIKTKCAAIARMPVRDREHLCTIHVDGEALVLTQLHWPDEIRTPAGLELAIPDGKVDPEQLRVAVQIVNGMITAFDPDEWRDEFRAAIMEIVEAKLSGAVPVAKPMPNVAPAPDLMAALKASLEKTSPKAAPKLPKATGPVRSAPARRAAAKARKAS